MKHIAVVVTDADGQLEYNSIFLAPVGMDKDEAATIVNNAVKQVKAANPESFTFDELESVLTAKGFEVPTYVNATETW